MQHQNVEGYDNRVKEILQALASGKTRDVIAKELGHANYKTIDMYMRRKNFKWNSSNNTYINKNSDVQRNEKFYNITDEPNMAAVIISHLDKEHADIKAIAKLMGFSDHRDMASYMKSKGYIWDIEKNNYVDQGGGVAEESQITAIKSKVTDDNEEELDINKYISILDLLAKNKDRLLKVFLDENNYENAKIPRYIMPGVFITKSVHMASCLDSMVKEFSRDKNISQREIFEIALIEFFKKYGYEREVKGLLGV